MTGNSAQMGVVIVAGGRSSRMGGVDKQTMFLGDESVIAHSLRVFETFDEVGVVVLVVLTWTGT